MIPSDDRGFTLGDGLFETVLWEDGALALWPEHVQRLAAGCAVIGLPPPDPSEALAAALAAGETLDKVRGAVRLSWTAGSGGRGLDRPGAITPRLSVEAAPSPLPAPARLALVVTRRNDGSPASRIKSLSYLDNVLARREALAAGADEAVMLNTRGELACAAAANLFWLKDGALFTPALDCGVLAGVMRARLIQSEKVREVHAGPQALREADAIYLTNSLVGVRPVISLDGISIPAGPEISSPNR